MNERAQLIKTAMMVELSKAGMTLNDLEESLSGQEKKAAERYDMSKVPKGLGHLFNLAGGIVVGGGMALGLGGYGAYLQNEDSTNKIMKKMKEQQQYVDAARRLQHDMQDPIKL